MTDEKLSGEERLACSVILGALARATFEKGHGNTFEVETGIATERVINDCLRRINAKTGWTAERTELGIRATRDSVKRKPAF